MQEDNDENSINFNTRTIYYPTMNKNVTILSQDYNGPCMLIAIVNALILKGKITLQNKEYSLSSIIQILQRLCKELPDLDYLIYGYDINPYFSDCSQFKDYPNFLNLLNLKMFHSIVCDPRSPIYNTVTKYDYDSFQIRLVENDEKGNNSMKKSCSLNEINKWNDEVQKQTTKYGILNIRSSLHENEIAIYFRANHFSVITKHNGTLLCLLTDEGFNYTEFVWESIPDERGNSTFYDSMFNALIQDSHENLRESLESFIQSSSQLISDASKDNIKGSITQAILKEKSKEKIYADTSTDEEDMSQTYNLSKQQRDIEKVQNYNPNNISAAYILNTNRKN